MTKRVIAFLSVLFLNAGLLAVPPAGAAVPGLEFTDTGCEGYSDSVARLYTAGLGRAPEQEGFDFWMVQYTLGQFSLMDMADFFVSGTEFELSYGSLNQEEFVKQIYRNILGREGEAEGVAFWNQRMTDGVTRGNLLVLFAESPENISRSGTQTPTLGEFTTGLDKPWSCGGWTPANPDSVNVSGTGDKVVSVSKPSDYLIADVSYVGEGHFSIWSYGADGERIDLLANEIGDYTGRVLIDKGDDDHTVALEVSGSGNWQVTYYPFSAIRLEAASDITGTGDDVFFLETATTGLTVGTFSMAAQSNFIIWSYTENNRDLLVNEIGPYTGEAVVDPGTVLFEVTAEGPWSVGLG